MSNIFYENMVNFLTYKAQNKRTKRIGYVLRKYYCGDYTREYFSYYTASFVSKPCRRFFIKHGRSGGRNNKGHFSATGTGRIVQFKQLRMNINLSYLTSLIFICKFFYSRRLHKHYALVITQSGGMSIIPYHKSMGLLQYSCLTTMSFFSDIIEYQLFRTIKFFCNQLIQFSSGTYISHVTNYSNQSPKYAKSTGCFGILKRKFKGSKHCSIQLPSTSYRVFHLYDMAYRNSSFKEKIYLTKKRKAGFYIKLGVKPRVRGVAKNPVDHPHGGREKTVRCPVTPWGKSTK